MTQLNTCRNTFKYAERGDILTYTDDCTNTDGTYRTDRRNRAINTVAGVNCTYRTTCADELRSKLTEYAGCACGAASTNGYTGEFIDAAMELNWNRFCPGIEIECAANGVVKLLYKYWKARYKFRVAVAKAAITEAIKQKIKEKIAESITITENEAGTTTRRRILQDSSLWAIEIESSDKRAIAADIAAELNGATVDNTEVDSEEAEQENTGTYEGDATRNAAAGATGESDANKYMIYGAIGAVIFALVH